jgi:hypothetical protein
MFSSWVTSSKIATLGTSWQKKKEIGQEIKTLTWQLSLPLYEDRATKIEKKYCIEKCIFMENLGPSCYTGQRLFSPKSTFHGL